MISRDAARRMVSTFAGHRGYPDNAESLKVLVGAFQKASADERHAQLIVEELQIDTEFCPRSAEVWRVAHATRPEGASGEPCGECGGSGWLESQVEHDGVLVGCVTRCKCVRGPQ